MGGALGSIVLGSSVLGVIVALGGCGRDHGSDVSSSARDEAAGGGASDVPPKAPRAFAIGEVQPLGEELSFAFKAGYHSQEQIWLRGVEGALARVSTWEVDPGYEDSCGAGWSTIGYVGGRFGRMQFDAQGNHLLFTELQQCHGGRREFPSRVLAHELASGVTRVLLETSVRPDILVGAGTAIVIVRREQVTSPRQPTPPGGLELYEFTGNALEPIAVPRGGDWMRVSAWEGGYLVRWNDRTLLVVDGVPALERVEGRWQPSELPVPFADSDVSDLRAAPSRARLCAITSRAKPEGGREASVGWVLEPDGRWFSVPSLSSWQATCLFAPDDSKVAFGSSFYALQDAQLVPVPFASARVRSFYGTWRGALYGTDVDTRGVARVDWSTLAIESALAADDLPMSCPDRSFQGGAPQLYVPPDERPLALLKASCGCADCDVSSSFAWHGQSGDLASIEAVWGEHHVYGFAWLADGGAVVLSTQGRRDQDGDELLRPERGQYFLVSAAAEVETLGPLPGVDGILHSPLSRP